MKRTKALLSCCAAFLVLGTTAACGAEGTNGATSTGSAGSGAQVTPTGKHEVDTLKEEGGTDWGAPNPYLHTSRGPGTAKMQLVFASLLENDEKRPVS